MRASLLMRFVKAFVIQFSKRAWKKEKTTFASDRKLYDGTGAVKDRINVMYSTVYPGEKRAIKIPRYTYTRSFRKIVKYSRVSGAELYFGSAFTARETRWVLNFTKYRPAMYICTYATPFLFSRHEHISGGIWDIIAGWLPLYRIAAESFNRLALFLHLHDNMIMNDDTESLPSNLSARIY